MLTTHTVDVTGVRGQLGLWSRDDEPATTAAVEVDVPVAIVRGAQTLNPSTEGAADLFTMIGPYEFDLIRFDTVTTSDGETYTVETVHRRRSVSSNQDHTSATIRLARGTG